MRGKIGLALCLVLLATVSVAAQLEVTFLDVGQGDSILIREEAGVVILIDGGTERAGRSILLPYLRSQGIEHLDLVVATHPHADHIGGLIPVLENLSVGRILADGQVHTTRTYERFLTIIDDQGIPFSLGRAGQSWEFINIDRFAVLHPKEPFIEGLNENSLVIKLQYGQVAFLFTGDLETTGEAQLLPYGDDLKAEVLKVGHHGSSSSTTADFLHQVSPEIAIIQAGVDNTYGHPHKEVVARLQAAGTLVYRTDELGSVIVVTDGQTYTVETSDIDGETANRVNLRTATKDQLTDISGIGPVLADRIIEFRQNQSLTSVEQLIEVQGIGPATLEALIEHLYWD